MVSTIRGRDTYVVGFDARRRGADRFGSRSERGAFLFRPDVKEVLSVDASIWPSVFERDAYRPSYVGFFQGFWESLRLLREQLRASMIVDAQLIAAALATNTVSEPDAARLDARFRGVSPGQPDEAVGELPDTDPPEIDMAWRLAGYDVCDEWGLSALSNCGFQPGVDDVVALRRQWGPRLNERHLFERQDDAVAFKASSDRRVTEHAPFFVYGLWLIPV